MEEDKYHPKGLSSIQLQRTGQCIHQTSRTYEEHERRRNASSSVLGFDVEIMYVDQGFASKSGKALEAHR